MFRIGHGFLWTLIGICGMTTVGRGQAIALHHLSEKPQDLQVRQLWRMTLTPMPEDALALRHSLLPRYWEQRAGDATPFYLRALMQEAALPQETRDTYRDHADDWTVNTLDADTRDAMRQWLSAYNTLLDDLRVATYRERIDMDLRLRDLSGLDAIYFRLPEAQKARDVARMLQIKVRLEIAEQRYDDAIETLRMGYRLAVFAAQTPTLINDLVGVAIANIMTHELVRLIGSPNAPNMYWAIASLPRPLIDMREAFEHESGFAQQIYPFLQDPETAERTPEQWQQLIVEVFTSAHELTGDYPEKEGAISVAKAKEMITRGYPVAKASLLDEGLDPQVVEGMSAGQVIAVHAARRNRRLNEESYKWFLLSFAEARRHWGLAPPDRESGASTTPADSGEVLPVTSILIPNYRLAWHATMRIDRQLAALRAIEAIRMHVAANQGKLPHSLTDVTAAVVPDDPFLNQPFNYRRDVEVATLTTKAVGTDEPRHEIYRYELRVKSP